MKAIASAAWAVKRPAYFPYCKNVPLPRRLSAPPGGALPREALAERIARGKYILPQERAMLACKNPGLLQKADEANWLRLRLKARLNESRNRTQYHQTVMHAVSSLVPPPGIGKGMDTQTALLRMAAIRAAQQPGGKG